MLWKRTPWWWPLLLGVGYLVIAPTSYADEALEVALTPEQYEATFAQPEAFYLDRAPLLNPLMLSDFVGSLSDVGNQILLLHLANAQESNRYFCESELVVSEPPESPTPNVSCDSGDLRLQYRSLGHFSNQLQAVHVVKNYLAGTGEFHYILLLGYVPTTDFEWDFDRGEFKGREIVALKNLGVIPLEASPQRIVLEGPKLRIDFSRSSGASSIAP